MKKDKRESATMTLRRIRKLLTEEIRSIDLDERFHYPTATIVENAPLALIQLGMETRIRLAKKLLAALKS